MKPTTARMLEELRQLTNGLVFSTEGDYYVDPFVWESDEQGELTLDKLLEAEGYLEEVEIESVFPQSKQFPREQPVTELFSADKKIRIAQLFAVSLYRSAGLCRFKN